MTKYLIFLIVLAGCTRPITCEDTTVSTLKQELDKNYDSKSETCDWTFFSNNNKPYYHFKLLCTPQNYNGSILKTKKCLKIKHNLLKIKVQDLHFHWVDAEKASVATDVENVRISW